MLRQLIPIIWNQHRLERLDKEETNSVFGIGTMDQAEIDRLLGFGKEEINVNKDFDDGENLPILEASWVDEVVDELNHTQDNHIDTLEERAFERMKKNSC